MDFRNYLFGSFLLAFMVSCNGQAILGVQHFARQRMEQESWNQIVRNAEDHDRLVTNVPEAELYQELKTSLFPTTSNHNYSMQCIEDSLFYIESLLVNKSKWALESKPLN